MITREFNLYLHAGHSIPLVINANQYDHGEQWLFTLFNSDGTQYVPSSGAIVGIKSDNLGIINSGSVDSNGRVVINETQQMTAAVGKAVFELLIDDSTHGTANFVVLVEAKPGDNADLSETDISMIEQAIEAAANIKPYGSPLVASTVAGMTDHDKVYVYTGSETGYTSGHWYYYDGDSWEDGGVYNSVAVQTDTTLALSGVAADAKKTGDEISDLKSQIALNSGIPYAVKLALDNILQNVAFKNDDGYASDLSAIHSWATDINVLYITAVYTQSGTVYTSDFLNDLEADLVVTAYYDNGTSETVSGYTLSGELAEGTSTITVTYGGKATAFNVTVTKGVPSGYTRYDYITTPATNSKALGRGCLMPTKTYADLNSISVEFDYVSAVGASIGDCIFGGRTASGATSSFAFYTAEEKIVYHLHGDDSSIAIPQTQNEKHRVILTNRSASPSTLSFDGTEYSIAWSNSNTINTFLSLFTNQQVGTANIYLKDDIKLGTLTVRDLSGNVINIYMPCIRNSDNVIGLYDIVEENFYTCSTVTYATVGNANNKYSVGNWS